MTRPTAVTPLGATTINLPAPGVPYYTPVQQPLVGRALDPTAPDLPTLFKPLRIRGVELPNRFVVSPMCMYSADNGHMTDFHLVHLAKFALYGAGLTCIEATSVLPNGRLSPEDVGLWQDSQVPPLRRVVDAIHSQGHKAAIQLGHGGRKASMLPLWMTEGRALVAADEGGWPDDTWSASALPYDVDWPEPHAMTVAEIDTIVDAFVSAAKRAVDAGIDVIEVHGAHGYLIGQFLSPLSNKRTDDYGGSFANRVRLATRILAAVRAAIPESMPLFFRVSGTDWMEHSGEPSWTLQDTIELAKLLPGLGVDLLDISSSGNVPQQKIPMDDPRYQINLTAAVKKALKGTPSEKLLVSAVGFIRDAETARDVAQQGGDVEADLVMVARQFLREPEFVLHAAHALGVDTTWPKQYARAQWKKGETV